MLFPLYLAKSTEGGLSLLGSLALNALKVGVKKEPSSHKICSCELFNFTTEELLTMPSAKHFFSSESSFTLFYSQ